jgi:hypothetical protein
LASSLPAFGNSLKALKKHVTPNPATGLGDDDDDDDDDVKLHSPSTPERTQDDRSYDAD